MSLKEYGFSFRFDKDTMRAVADIGSSALVEQVFLRIGFLMYAMIVARLGTLEFAAHQVGMNIMSVSFSFGDGLSVAAVALVGRSLGEGRKNLAKTYGRTCQQLGLGFASILSVIFLTCSRPIFQLFSDEEEILVYSMMIMCTMSVSVFLQISQVVYMGCLRGAGDTKYTALISLISVAIVRPGFGWLFMLSSGSWAHRSMDRPGIRSVRAFCYGMDPFPPGKVGRSCNLISRLLLQEIFLWEAGSGISERRRDENRKKILIFARSA